MGCENWTLTRIMADLCGIMQTSEKAALEVFNGYFQRIDEGRRDYDLITEEVLC